MMRSSIYESANKPSRNAKVSAGPTFIGENMVRQVLIGVAIVLAAAVLYLWAVGNFKKKSNDLTKFIYVDHDFESYKKLANSLMCKMFLSQKQRLLLDSAMYEYLKLDDELQSCLNKLNAKKLTDQEWLNVNYMQMKLYIRQMNEEAAENLSTNVQLRFDRTESPYIRGIVKEFEYLYFVDFKQDSSYLEQMEKLANKVDVKYSKGLFYLRSAILKNSVGRSYTGSLNKAREILNDDVVKEILRSIGYKSFPEFCS